MLATDVGGCGGAAASAAAVAVAAAAQGDGDRPAPVVVAEVDARSARGPTMLASAAARELERELAGVGLRAAARGALAWLTLPGGEEGLDELERALDEAAAARLVVVLVPSRLWNRALGRLGPRVGGALLRCDLPDRRSLAALAAIELRAREVRTRIDSRGCGPLAARRALAGLDPGGAAGRRTRRIARSLLGAAASTARPLTAR